MARDDIPPDKSSADNGEDDATAASNGEDRSPEKTPERDEEKKKPGGILAKPAKVDSLISQELTDAVGPTLSAKPPSSHPGVKRIDRRSRRDEDDDDEEDQLLGTVLAERYRLEERIGEGGMGVVYRAEHVELNKKVAVKVLLPELGAVESVVKRFRREARSVSKLDHPGIIRVTDFGRSSEGLLYLVMEFLEGEPLSKIIAEEAPLPPERAVSITQQILLSLDHAHGLGVVHRDLKPDNIMVFAKSEGRDTTRILDFGIAKITEAQADAGGDEKLTVDGMVFGTPEYLSPEQASGDPVDERADLYAVGIILYELITRERPFTAENRMALLGKHLNQKPEPLHSIVPRDAVPDGLNSVVMGALEKQPSKRFQTAMDFYAALSDLPLDAAPVTFWPMPQGWDEFTAGRLKVAKRRRWLRYLFLLLVLGALGAGGYLGYQYYFKKPEKTKKTAKKVDPLAGKTDPITVQMRVARGHLAAVHPDKALAILKPLFKKHVNNPFVHFLMGRAYFMKGSRLHKEKALTHYATAIALRPELKNDKGILNDIETLLHSKWRKEREAAIEFIDKHLGKAASPMIEKLSKESNEYKVIGAALVVAEKHGFGDVIDKLRFYRIMLRDSSHCAERRVAARQLMLLGNPRALSWLIYARWRKPWKFRGRTLSNRCIVPTLKKAIKKLHEIRKKTGYKPRPRAARTRPTARKTIRRRRRTRRRRTTSRKRRRRRVVRR